MADLPSLNPSLCNHCANRNLRILTVKTIEFAENFAVQRESLPMSRSASGFHGRHNPIQLRFMQYVLSGTVIAHKFGDGYRNKNNDRTSVF